MFTHVSTRRAFIQRGLALLAASPTVPGFLNQTAFAMLDEESNPAALAGKDGKILVIVQLSGGNDGLNTVVPHGDDVYHRARPSLGHAADKVLKINDYLGLHPNLSGLKALYDEGVMSIVQGVGYPNPNRSHFRAMDIWQSAQPEREAPSSGWLGRFFDNSCNGADPHAGVSIGESVPLAMKGERTSPLSFEKPENYRYTGRDKKRFLRVNDINDTAPATQPVFSPAASPAADQLQFLTRTALDAQLSSDRILRVSRSYQSSSKYPGGELGTGLRTIAAMIAGGLPTRVYYVSLGGFDTHANERGRHDNLMSQLSAGVSAFWDDMKSQGNTDRVLMMTFSEFGRRVEQNASGGTDHGAAAPMFFFGPSVKGGLLGDHPSLTQLEQGDLKFHTDFRQVYSTVLQEWLDAPSKSVLGRQFKPVSLLKG